MKYPIVQVETKGEIWLHGLFLEAEKSKTVFLHTHGTASNFYEEDFIQAITETFVSQRMSVLSVNNRGVSTYDVWDNKGHATEIFEDCIYDLDAWMGFVLEKGYENIILSGHSLGTEKVVYYMDKGKYKDKIKGVALLAPADSPRFRCYDKNYQPSEKGKVRVDEAIKKAEQYVQEGKGDELILSAYGMLAGGGKMPRTGNALLNWLGEKTEIIKTLPFHSGRLEMYSKINIPIFVAIGDQEEYTAIPPKEALALMTKENPHTETHYIHNCDHDFTDNEKNLAQLLLEFVLRIK